MKKFFITFFVFIVTLFSFNINIVNADCVYSSGSSINDNLTQCLNDSAVYNSSEGDLKLEGDGIKNKTTSIIDNISIFLAILAIGSIVLGGLMMTISTGEEEKVKKAKDMVKWGIIGFIGVISASTIIRVVVSFIYNI